MIIVGRRIDSAGRRDTDMTAQSRDPSRIRMSRAGLVRSKARSSPRPEKSSPNAASVARAWIFPINASSVLAIGGPTSALPPVNLMNTSSQPLA
ncbi:hypothetical protein B5D80_28000 [Micromonospora wenchangensis]|uniref:Uncharacterized protein n=1 Tax=Micromonospora wenchangensis TaxID=1185415 RepID=A0A246RGD5_9ACTN|nr:hypothetical protein B5D80_28000 [Micromonospora wenchangensis]